MTRSSEANYSWLATIVTDPNSSAMDTKVTVSVAVFYKRDLSSAGAKENTALFIHAGCQRFSARPDRRVRLSGGGPPGPVDHAGRPVTVPNPVRRPANAYDTSARWYRVIGAPR